MKLTANFDIDYDLKQKPSIKPKIREPTPEQTFKQEENHSYKVLADYFHELKAWKPCEREAISSTCLIFSCMALLKKRKL